MKIRFYVSALLTGACFAASLFAQNKIDAVSSATKNISVDSGWAYDTAAVLYTYTKDSYDRQIIAFGTSESTLTDTVIRPPFPREITCTLSVLKPGTQYFYKFVSGLSTNWPTESHGVKGTFTTLSPTAVSNGISKKDAPNISISGHTLVLPETEEQNLTAELFTLQGRSVYRKEIGSARSGASIPLPYGLSGTYIILIRSGKVQISLSKCLFTN